MITVYTFISIGYVSDMCCVLLQQSPLHIYYVRYFTKTPTSLSKIYVCASLGGVFLLYRTNFPIKQKRTFAYTIWQRLFYIQGFKIIIVSNNLVLPAHIICQYMALLQKQMPQLLVSLLQHELRFSLIS